MDRPLVDGFSVNTRVIYSNRLARAVHFTTLEASRTNQGLVTTAASAFAIPKRYILDTNVVSRAGRELIADPERFLHLIDEHLLYHSYPIHQIKEYLDYLDYSMRHQHGEWDSLYAAKAIIKGRQPVYGNPLLFGLTDVGFRSHSGGRWIADRYEIAEEAVPVLLSAIFSMASAFRDEGETNDILSYEVPYGLSPQMDARSAVDLFRIAKHTAYIPLFLGIEQSVVSGAQHEWALAAQYGASGVGVAILILSMSAIGDRMVRWLAARGEDNDHSSESPDSAANPRRDKSKEK